MEVIVNKTKLNVDKVFVNKQIKVMPVGTKVQMWFNNLTFSDFVFLEDMSGDMFDNYGFDDFKKPFSSYKKNIVFVNDKEVKGNVTLYCGCFVNVLEKDRCLLSFDRKYVLELNKFQETFKGEIKKEIRKEKIANLLNECKDFDI
jgi:hypothetical protein